MFAEQAVGRGEDPLLGIKFGGRPP
jgi:hypothetical protein